MLVFAFFIIAQIVYLQITEVTSDEDTKTLKLKNVKIAPNRGDILAADGRMLASSIPYYEIRMDTRSTGMKSKVFNSKIDSLALGLSILFRDKSAKVYKKQIMNARKNGDRFYLIKRRVDYNQLKKLKTFPIFRLGQYKGGLIVLQKNVRIKPHASLASRTIGYVRNNNVGLERAFNNELKGIAGVRLMQKISGNIWMPVHDGNEIEPKDGLDVVTTIDINIQDVAESALRKQLERQEAAYGTAVLMEVATGKIKAIVNLKRDSRGKYKERFNYAVGRRSSPGSTFKLASIIALLEDGYVALEDSVDTGNGIYKYYDKKIVDTKRGGHGKISVQKVFEVSSNVGISKLVIENYKGKEKKFINRLYELNLNNRLEVPITGEAKPDINYPGKMSASGKPLWSEISLPQMAIGYEVELTALQILTLYNAIANNGKMVKPRFVEGLMYHGNWIKTYNTEVIKQSICSRTTLRKVRKVLKGVVERGTARNLQNENYKIAGKTGTAQIADKKTGFRDKSRISHQASFAGYFPADNPKYSCIVVVNAPSKNVYYGNLVAGPVFKEIADKVYATNFEMHENLNIKNRNIDEKIKIPYTKNSYKDELKYTLTNLGIKFNDQKAFSDWVSTTKLDSCVNLLSKKIKSDLMPDVKGMGVKDAIYILENMGLTVDIVGRGTILKQSISPGSRIRKGDLVKLEMSFN